MKLSLLEPLDKANISFCRIEYELNGLVGTSHIIDHTSVHIQFDLKYIFRSKFIFGAISVSDFIAKSYCKWYQLPFKVGHVNCL